MYSLRHSSLRLLAIAAVFGFSVSCMQKEDINSVPAPGKKKMGFDVSVTREGQSIPSSAITRGATVESSDGKIATMDKDIPFGLVGIDTENELLILDNQAIYADSHGYSGLFDLSLWEVPNTISLSAYYPYVDNISYSENLDTYSIPYQASDTEAGPTVSKTVQAAISQLNMVPLEFQHITNDIGYMICDVTADPKLQGLIHLRKVTAYKVASAGIFVNDVAMSRGTWHKQGYYRNVVVFEGDAPVGVGLENEKFIGKDALVSRFSESSRYYSIPDEIKIGKQYVKVEYDIDGFTLNGFEYPPLKGQTAKYMLYGLLPDNVFVYGRQYTFHLGLDLGSVYSEITFSPTVSEWETKIYENNDVF